MHADMDATLRRIIHEEVRTVLREELRTAFAEHAESEDDKPSDPTARRFLTVAQAARVAAVNTSTIRRWIGQGRLETYRAGRVIRVCPRDLENYLTGSPPEAVTRNDIRERARRIVASHTH